MDLEEGQAAPQAGCRICQTFLLPTWSSMRIDASMKDLQTSAAEGCRLCDLAFKCVATHEDYSNPVEMLNQVVSIYWVPVSTSVTSNPSARPPRIRFHLSYTRKVTDGRAQDMIRHADANKFLSIYSRAYHTREYCELRAKGIEIEIELEKSPRSIAAKADSTQCFQLIDKWIRDCTTKHGECAPVTPAQLPTRVLDVGTSSDGNSVRLVLNESVSGRYIALSHCWGGGYVVKTLQCVAQDDESSISSRMRGFPISRLTATFKDAVYITRKLGIRYLWIDSLCILQDSEHTEDWERESAKMASIYEGAYLTIAATSAPSGKAGCLRSRPTKSGKVPDFECKSGNSVYVRESLEHNLFDFKFQRARDYTCTPLLGRGWCFQERILSTRVLHYTDYELVWECKADMKCECGDVGNVEMGKPYYSRMLDAARASSRLNSLSHDMPSFWRRHIHLYSELTLTRDYDVFPALSGIASKFQSPVLGSYMAGLWEHDLAAGLFWQSTYGSNPKSPNEVADFYRAPSWSWASIKGRIVFHLQENINPSFQLLEFECTPKGLNPTGELVSAYIRVRGLVIKAQLYTAGPWPTVVVKRSRMEKWEHFFGFDARLSDHELAALHGIDVFFLQLSCPRNHAHCVILNKKLSGVETDRVDGGTYERLGALTVPSDLFLGANEVVVTLV